MLRWVWPILFISYVKCACCIPFRRFSAGNHDYFFFSFHIQIAPWFSNVSPQVSISCPSAFDWHSLFRRRPLMYFQTRRICERKIWPNFLCSQHPKLAKRCLIHRTRFDELSLLRPRMNCTKIMQAFANRKTIKLFDTRSSAFHLFLYVENVQ